MNKKIIVNIAFNIINCDNIFLKKGIDPPGLTREWIEYRIDIFMNYTYKSLVNQTNQSFTALIYYDKSTKNIIEECLNKYPRLQSNIIFTSNINETKKYINGYTEVYMVRLDCDDMYKSDFIEKLLNYKHEKSTKVLINQSGYVYDIIHQKLGIWYYKCPPFYTAIYDVNDYLRGRAKYNITTSHGPMFNYKHEILDNGNFMVIIHEKNTMNKYEHNIHYMGDILDKNHKIRILNEFNL